MNGGFTINLISGTHHLCERREYVFMVLQEYTIISLRWYGDKVFNQLLIQVLSLMYVTTFDKDATCACGCEREEQTRIKSK